MEAVFTFHSTHGAIAGEKVLRDGGVAVRVMSLPSSLGAGCGLCLRVGADELSRAAALFAQARIDPQGVYAKSFADGGTHYIELHRDGEAWTPRDRKESMMGDGGP